MGLLSNLYNYSYDKKRLGMLKDILESDIDLFRKILSGGIYKGNVYRYYYSDGSYLDLFDVKYYIDGDGNLRINGKTFDGEVKDLPFKTDDNKYDDIFGLLIGLLLESGLGGNSVEYKRFRFGSSDSAQLQGYRDVFVSIDNTPIGLTLKIDVNGANYVNTVLSDENYYYSIDRICFNPSDGQYDIHVGYMGKDIYVYTNYDLSHEGFCFIPDRDMVWDYNFYIRFYKSNFGSVDWNLYMIYHLLNKFE